MKYGGKNKERWDGFVAPFAGAWIEIGSRKGLYFIVWSLPSRERGLKLIGDLAKLLRQNVAPFAGAWIEIASGSGGAFGHDRRSLRGSVD